MTPDWYRRTKQANGKWLPKRTSAEGRRSASHAAPPSALCPPPSAQLDLADLGRREFVKALDAADLEVSDWEAGFLETCLRFTDQDRPFTDKMRPHIDRLMNKYLGRVKWGDNKITGPVRSKTREAYVPDERRELFQKRL